MKQKIYIKGAAAISPQKTFENNSLPEDLNNAVENRFRCLEPVYSDYLNPVMARRMGKIVKMGIATAIKCLQNSNVAMPGAIISGTALGCLGDTEKFLSAVIKDDEQYLTPTWFIQSLQNTVSAQIALHLKCINHNFTFVHKGFSFESALLDAAMLIRNGEADDILAGGLDEMTDHNFHIYGRLNKWKKEIVDTNSLLKFNSSRGTIAGEGAAFFTLSGEKNTVSIEEIETVYGDQNSIILEKLIHKIDRFNLPLNSKTLVLYGFSGDKENDKPYSEIMEGKLRSCESGYFKRLCGEYQTSSAFATWLGYSILEKGYTPQYLGINKFTTKHDHVLVVNHYENNYSLILLSKNQKDF